MLIQNFSVHVSLHESDNSSGHDVCCRLKLDEGDDRDFYAIPRLVKHVDDRFLAQVSCTMLMCLPPNAVLSCAD